jgi:hypothetical protein
MASQQPRNQGFLRNTLRMVADCQLDLGAINSQEREDLYLTSLGRPRSDSTNPASWRAASRALPCAGCLPAISRETELTRADRILRSFPSLPVRSRWAAPVSAPRGLCAIRWGTGKWKTGKWILCDFPVFHLPVFRFRPYHPEHGLPLSVGRPSREASDLCQHQGICYKARVSSCPFSRTRVAQAVGRRCMLPANVGEFIPCQFRLSG